MGTCLVLALSSVALRSDNTTKPSVKVLAFFDILNRLLYVQLVQVPEK